MSKTISITATKRDAFGSANARRMRRAGLIPAVLYGHGSDAASITVTPADAEKILDHSGLVEITLDSGEKHHAVVKEIQTNPLSLKTLHLDFLEVRMDEIITAMIPVEHEGEPKGLQAGGQLEQQMMSVELKALPANMPDVIVVDVSNLGLDEVIHVKDLALPEGVAAAAHADQIVFQVRQPKRAAEPAPEAEAAAPEADAAAPAADAKAEKK